MKFIKGEWKNGLIGCRYTKALVNDELYNYNEFIDNIQLLIKKARENNVEVIYVVHDDGIGSGLTKGTDGFEVFEKFKPLSNEKLFVKSVNSAFKDTGLVEYLAENNEKDIIIVGLQTDKCINATDNKRILNMALI